VPEDYRRLFGYEGPLAQRLGGFQPRPGQAAMAEAVAAAIEHQGCLIVEAGTGTGKTLAYLLPALLSGRKVLISTGTKALQEQLFDKDLPVARAALQLPVRVALLKGRANYLCLHRLDLALQQGRPRPPAQQALLRRIREWSARTACGDLAEVGDIADGLPVWSQVSSTADNCLGSDCPRVGECHPLKARRQALEADVVVVNHHLFFADLAVKQGGFGELLPQADAVILDEAHQVPDTASLFFSTSLGARQLDDLARDVRAEYASTAGDTPELELCLRELEAATLRLDRALAGQPGRAAWPAAMRGEAAAALERLREALIALEALLEALAPRSLGLESCHLRCKARIECLDFLVRESQGQVRWVEKFTQGFALNATPLDIATPFRQLMQAHPAAWIFTSATLAVGRRFEHFSSRLGLEDPQALVFDSPFDYRHNALLYLPRGLPDPNAPDYTAAVVQAALPLIRASGGGAFVLCTSHRALQEAAALLRPQLGTLPLLVQGELGRGELLARFRAAGNAVLVGTSSFWEGVDVRGTALRLVIIDRLPFSSPGDPVLQARLDALREQGNDPFRSHQLPQAVIALKQGAGRLIRDATDRGVLMLCDPRLFSRPYGKTFLGSLPPMPVCRDVQRACDFFRQQAVA
jgi:ATP-dependent DNA helicase DinG